MDAPPSPTAAASAEPLRNGEKNLGEACKEQYVASLRCLDKNNYDRTKCTDFFMAYKDCKKQWNLDRAAERKRKNGWG